MILRPYQNDCAQAIADGFAAGHRKQLTYLPTGGGKTVVFLSEAQRRLALGQEVLILAHRDDLVRQPVARAADMARKVEKKKKLQAWRGDVAENVGDCYILADAMLAARKIQPGAQP